jgi:hypothetical protein
MKHGSITGLADRLIHAERAIYFALVLIALIPVWLPERFPSQDGPIHLYIAYIARRLAEPDGAAFRAFFEYNPYLEPNALIYWLLGAFGRILPPLTSEKLLVTLYWLSFAGAARYAVTALGRENAVLAFLLLPLGFGYFLHFGFYNFSFGVAGFLLLFGFALRRADRLDYRTLAVIAAGAFAIVVTHLFAFAMFLASFGGARAGAAVARAVHRGGGRAWPAEAGRLAVEGVKIAIVCLPAFAVAISFYLRYMQSDAPPVHASLKFNLVRLASMGATHSLSRAEFFSLSPYVVLVWLLAGIAAWRWIRSRDRSAALATVLPALLLFAIYLLATVQVKHFPAQLRLLPFILCLMVLAIARIGVPTWARRLIVPVLAVAVTASAVERARFYRVADGAALALLEAGRVIEPGSTFRTHYTATRGEAFVATGNGWRVDVLLHVPALVAMQQDAISLNHDLLSPRKLGYFPVRYRPARDPYRDARPPGEARPLAGLERSIGMPVDYLLIWPNTAPPPSFSAQARGLGRATLGEARMRMTPLRGIAPLVFKRRPSPAAQAR